MRLPLLATAIAAAILPGIALAGPEGSFHVKGVNPDSGGEYTGTVNVTRKGDTYRIVWDIAGDKTVGVGVGIRIVDGQMVAGPASDLDGGISIAYGTGKIPGSATYTEFADGTWRGVWAYRGYRKISTEEWVPMVRQIKVKSLETATAKKAEAAVVPVKVEEVRTEVTPSRLSAPLPASASPKS